MRAEPPSTNPLRAQLDIALEEQVAVLELRVAEAWRGLAVLGIALSLFLGLRGSTPLALWGTIAAGLYLAWFATVARLLRAKRGTFALRIATSVMEGSAPWLFTILLAYTEGPAYALGSWVAPMLFGGVLIVTTARLRPLEPLVLGLSGGAVFAIIYFAWLRRALSTDEVAVALYSPRVQISRAITMVTAGALSMLVSRALRRAIGRADSTAREKELFGKYRLIRHLASGGMGSVHEALYCPEGGFERSVAMKRIHPHLAQDASFVTFFRNEAELSARLVHPNIVQVLDFGSVEGTYFLAMELVDGLTLRSLTRRAAMAQIKIPPAVVAYIGQQVLGGLAYSHTAARAADGSRLKVVHRDLCPANVLLSKSGEVKITDFGVARALRDAESTHTRTVAGHAGYMAPEQALALAVDERCDLFAVAVVLWELLCGRPLFLRGAEGPTLVAVLSSEILPPTALCPGLDPAWDTFIMRALSRERDLRFASAHEMSLALSALPEGDLASSDELAALVAEALTIPEPGPDLLRSTNPTVSTDSDAETRVDRSDTEGAA